MSVLPHPSVVSPVTGAGLRTVDHVLDRNVSRWPRSFPLYVDAIYEAEVPPPQKNVLPWKSSAQAERILYQEVPICSSLTEFNLHTVKWSDSSQQCPNYTFGRISCVHTCINLKSNLWLQLKFLTLTVQKIQIV